MPEKTEEKKTIMLSKKPQNVMLIEGFPGFGLIGTIVTEFLIEHLQCEKIGTYWFEDLPATIAIHESKVVDPIGVYYAKSKNLAIVHSISGSAGIEWDAAKIIMNVADQLKAKEIISVEGVGSPMPSEESNVFYYASKANAKLKSLGLEPLKEGIIMGVTGALLMKAKTPLTCVFAETHSQLPDSKAAAKVLELLGKYIGFDVDVKPLLEKAEKFEEKLKKILSQSSKAEEESEKKKMSYVG